MNKLLQQNFKAKFNILVLYFWLFVQCNPVMFMQIRNKTCTSCYVCDIFTLHIYSFILIDTFLESFFSEHSMDKIVRVSKSACIDMGGGGSN